MADSPLLPQLREALDMNCSLDEVIELAFDLRLNHEDWPDKGKPSMIRNLLLTLDRTQRIDELLSLLRRKHPGVAWPGLTQDPNAVSPYKGLQVFEVGDAALFFGRESLTRQLIEKLHTTRFLFVVGASGSGKSSLVRAGVVATLLGRKAAPRDLKLLDGISERNTIILTPTDRPLRELAIRLTHDEDSARATKALIDDMRGDAESLDLYAGKRLQSEGHARLLIVVDQFEELFTNCKDEAEQRMFIENLRYAADDAHSGPVTVIITLRADFYEKCAAFDAFYKMLPKYQVNVSAMQPDELREAIEEPARLSGLTLEPGLTETLLKDIGEEPGALPLLSHVLLEIWQRRDGNTLTMRGYADAGGLRGAIAASAERAYAALPHEEQAIAQHIFIELTALNTDAPDTRRRVKLTELLSNTERAKQATDVINRYVQARLVTVGEGQTYEVAHEALIRNWPKLASWLQANRSDLLLARQIQESAERWRDNGKDPSDLYRGLRLKEAVEWLNTHVSENTQTQHKFIDASQQEEARQLTKLQALEARATTAEEVTKASEKRAEVADIRTKRARQLLFALMTIALVLLGVGFIVGTNLRRDAAAAVIQMQTATAQVAVAASTLLPIPATLTAVSSEIQNAQAKGTKVAREVMISQSLFRSDQARREAKEGKTRNAFVLALESLKDYPLIFNPESSLALDDAEKYPLREKAFQHDSYVYGATWNKDESKILTWSIDHTARVWEVASDKQLLILQHDNSVAGAIWNKDESKILTWSDDKTARVWDAISGKQLLILQHDFMVFGAIWSKDESKILTWSYDNTARVWEATSGKQLLILQHSESVEGAIWNKDGSKILTWSADNPAQLWDAISGKQLLILQHNDSVAGARWNTDESKILTWSFDISAWVWNVAIEYDMHYARDWLAHASRMPDSERKRLGLPTETSTPIQ